mmetsp:Transcript_11583/g.15106  ORF Transcript_11583/g.15106 Transcript_11583/m.15106 type:complete len:297 (+) Transcript_11583:222-1112(+)|eukprot:CAMPEP_0204865764 /NCGR_PEP_ID=MMETSP1348-20121228/13294_1 /ASSEMBLY_ACC=CAM_ASM_000700 /TAXON_ID=215587 /ORGANISM="Aplanochytrium stocchinoi, Strain GSBS06" /LENGTH=296 /DNA_ID=CAMNT_0052017265 /DNA_START=156 /DNA_END=1049 /DNA_ORIENTATION=-
MFSWSGLKNVLWGEDEEGLTVEERRRRQLEVERQQDVRFKRREELTDDEIDMLDFVNAAAEGNLEYVNSHIYLMNGFTYAKDCALVSAARNGHEQIIKRFVQQGSALHIDIKDPDEATALMESAGSGHNEIVKLLLEGGASVNKCDVNGWTALHYAAHGGNVETLQLLIKAGADEKCIARSGNTTALYLAAHENKIDNVKYLLSLLADPRFPDSDGNKPVDVTEDDIIHSLLLKAEHLWETADKRYLENGIANSTESDTLNPETSESSNEKEKISQIANIVKPLLDDLFQSYESRC